jgi:glycosyltransferase involved in cell wall biosynthesis
MNGLYISHGQQRTGWGNAARLHIQALLAAGEVLSVRSVIADNAVIPFDELPDFYRECHNLELRPDYIIQHLLPNYYVKDYRCPSLAYFACETTLHNHEFIDHCNQMDGVLVPSIRCKQQLEESGLKVPCKVVHHPIDFSLYSRNYPKLPISQLEGKFVFYFVGEFTKRKNLSALVKAFHTEFAPDENVALLIKTNAPNDKVHRFCEEIRAGLKLRKHYQSELVISERLDEARMMALHNTGDCLVSPSFGEACCLPILEAQAFGNTVIATQNTGMDDYISPAGHLVPSRKEPCFAAMDTLPNLYDADNYWQSIDIADLMAVMRVVYLGGVTNADTKIMNIQHASEFDLDIIGGKMVETIKELINV